MAAAAWLVATSLSFSQPVIGEGALPAFESASVQPSHPAVRKRLNVDPLTGDFTAANVTLNDLIGFTFDLKIDADAIIGAPDWFSSARWYIEARAPEALRGREIGALMLEERRLVGGLLFDYFGLRARRSEAPVYTLESAGTGGPVPAGPSASPGALADDGRGRLRGQPVLMRDLAAALQRYLDRPVLDRTGLTGAYNVDLHWAAPDVSALAAVLRDEMGLVLGSVPVEVVIVDEVREKPPQLDPEPVFEVVPRPAL